MGGGTTRSGSFIHCGDLVVQARKANVFVDDFGHLGTVIISTDLFTVSGHKARDNQPCQGSENGKLHKERIGVRNRQGATKVGTKVEYKGFKIFGR